MRLNAKLVVATLVVLALVATAGGTALALFLGSDDGEDPESSTGPVEAVSTPPAPGSTAPPTPELEPFYSQDLQWESCDDNECARLTVPVDYRQPDDETFELNLVKAPATDADGRVGSLVVNPGGPGAPGTTMALDRGSYFRDQLTARFDIVGFDPRGTGDSNPVDCLSDADLDAFVAADPSPDDPGEPQQYAAARQAFFQGCVDSSDSLVGHVTTAETARDMDVLRAALGEEQLTYLGFSYGTSLGSTYAELYPDKVGRMVLDGATDPTLEKREDALSQAAGFETALRAYVEDCVESTDSCFLGDSTDEGLQRITDLLDQVDEEPLPTSLGRDLQIGNAFYGLVVPLYSRDSWMVLSQALRQAFGGDGSTLLLLSDLYGSREDETYTDNSLEAFSTIGCLDDPASLAPGNIPAEYAAFDQASPTLGRVFAWALVDCRGIQVESVEPPLDIRAEGSAPIVVIGTTRDPATPYEEAVALADQLASGVLVSRDGDGHTAYNKGNDCIDLAVEDYLIEGAVPEDGLEC